MSSVCTVLGYHGLSGYSAGITWTQCTVVRVSGIFSMHSIMPVQCVPYHVCSVCKVLCVFSDYVIICVLSVKYEMLLVYTVLCVFSG